MKKTLDTEPGQAVDVRARRAAKLIEAAVERRSGQTIGAITRDLFAQYRNEMRRCPACQRDAREKPVEFNAKCVLVPRR